MSRSVEKNEFEYMRLISFFQLKKIKSARERTESNGKVDRSTMNPELINNN
jgi:hypothetical protein